MLMPDIDASPLQIAAGPFSKGQGYRINRGRAHPMQILMVLSSYDRVGDNGPKTGFSLEEFTAAYYAFQDAGADTTLASPIGGQPPIDPRSDGSEDQSKTVKRFKGDFAARTALADTLRLEQV